MRMARLGTCNPTLQGFGLRLEGIQRLETFPKSTLRNPNAPTLTEP